ncbi:MAG: hypothetical protein H0T76_22200 [Nannocystis sp.]|nr:DNA methyltransferase [Nannocystis sp.]MBA3549194.1 hypothetical protein [Nannocystis sp.]
MPTSDPQASAPRRHHSARPLELRLTEQAPVALAALLRGFVAADAAMNGALLGPHRGDLMAIQRGLVTAVLRLLFMLHAEDRDLLPGGPRLTHLHQQLCAQASAPGCSGWAALIARFTQLSASDCGLFDPGDHLFLAQGARGQRPRVPDDALRQALGALLLVDGALIHHGTLELEMIGGAYEAMLGLRLVAGPDGALQLEPDAARRRSGTHYTPRTLTASIVRTTLEPLLAALGERPDAARLLDLKICDPALGCGAFLLAACHQLGEQLEAAWIRDHDGPQSTPDLAQRARRQIAAHCLHGVDLEPVAVELARRSLWLLTGAPGPAGAYLEANLRRGDALLGLEIAALDTVPIADLRREADAQIASHFAGDPESRPRWPFHWPLEFPAVFRRDNPGFDAIIGNPPFLGGRQITTHLGARYSLWLRRQQPGSSGAADLSARFFRRAFTLLRTGGALGLIATNTIAQGDTRQAGLAWICRNGGTIFAATRRLRWPGSAAVIVSVVHIIRGPDQRALPCRLDGRPSPRISHYLSRGGDAEPQRLAASAGLASQGCIILGSGFLFADDDPAATPLARMHELLAADPALRARILPYLGGADLNTSPTQSPSRFVIDLGDRSESAAREWPALMAILEAKVKPERARKTRDMARWPWWQFWRGRKDLYTRIRALPRVLALARVSQHLALAFVDVDIIHSEQLVLIADAGDPTFAVLQSRVHEIWARFFSSSLGDGLRYAPSDCLETFPLPSHWRSEEQLAALGARYHQRRAALMHRRGEGLTATYNRFHDRDEQDPEILELRELHAALDRAVLAAYGWHDLAAAARCEFQREHGGSARRRLGWSPALHDEVLARLLEQNHRDAAAP